MRIVRMVVDVAVLTSNGLDKVYKPRKKSLFVQDKLFDIPTDKQKARQK